MPIGAGSTGRSDRSDKSDTLSAYVSQHQMIMMPGGFAGCQRQQCASGPSAAVVRPPQPLLSQAVSAASAPSSLSLALGKRLSRATQRPHGARLVSTVPRPVWAWLPSLMRNISNDAHQHGGRAVGSFFARMIGRELRNRWTRSDECDRFSLTLPLPPTTASHNSATAVIWRCLVTSPCTASLAARLATADYLLRPSTCRQSSFTHWSELLHPSPVLQALPHSSLNPASEYSHSPIHVPRLLVLVQHLPHSVIQVPSEEPPEIIVCPRPDCALHLPSHCWWRSHVVLYCV